MLSVIFNLQNIDNLDEKSPTSVTPLEEEAPISEAESLNVHAEVVNDR